MTANNDASSYVEYGVHWVYTNGNEYFVGLGRGDEHRVMAYEMVCEFRETRPDSSVIERTVTVGEWRPRS